MKSLGTIVAVGMRTGIGLDAVSTSMLLRTGIPAFAAAPLADPDGAEPVTMSFDPTLDPFLVGEERAARLGGAALFELAGSLGSAARALRLQVALAFPEPRADQNRGEAGHALALAFRTMLQETFGSPPVEVATRGSAGLAYVLPDALRELAAGRVDAVLAGGLHSDYDPAAIAALSAARRLFSSTNVDAILPGEAAAFVLIMRDGTAGSLGLPAMARVHAIGTDQNELAATQPGRSFESTAFAGAIRQATNELPDELQIGWAVTDLGIEHAPVRELYSALTRTHKRFGPPLIVDAPAQRAGHLGAAALPLALGFIALGFRHGFAPAPLGLALAASEAGERAAILLASP